MKNYKITLIIAAAILAFPLFLKGETKVTYEDIAPAAIDIAPEKYKQKPLCITVKYKQPESLSWYFQQRSNINADRYYQLPVEDFRQVKAIAPKQTLADDIAKIKPNSLVKMYGRVKHFARVSNIKSSVFYFELEKIEDLSNSDSAKDDNKKSDKSK